MKHIISIILSLTVLSAVGQGYKTPPYGYFSFLHNSGKYTTKYGEVKVKNLYLDASSLMVNDKSILEFGAPVLGYLMSMAIADPKNITKAQGEISYIYFKYGHRFLKLEPKSGDGFSAFLGAGFSAEMKGMNIDTEVGEPAIGFMTASPFVYASLGLGKFAIVTPMFEYNVFSKTSNKEVKRTGYTAFAHIIVPLGERLAINVSPVYAFGKFTDNRVVDPATNPNFLVTDMQSSNFYIKVGLLKKF